MMVQRLKRFTLAALVAVSVVGCSSTGGERDERDPFEGFNRAMYSFNDGLDRAIIKPVAEGYRAVTPEPVDRGVTNFFSNLRDVNSAANNALQFKLGRASSDIFRFVINSTVGVFGFIDVASHLHLEKYDEDFGQTLGYWGVGPGPYLVLPVFGPRNIRDTVGLVVDWRMDPVAYVEPDEWRYGLYILRAIDMRADLLGASSVLEEAALDEYTFVRDAYLQKRRNDVHDGNLPQEESAGDDIPSDW